MPAPERLRDAFTRDRFLATATLFLALVTCGPLYVTPYVPLHDLPDHVGAANLMKDILQGDTVAAQHYRIQSLPVPYWTLYFLLAVGGLIVGPLLAAKLVVGLSVVLLPLGMMKLALALERDPRVGLLGFALAWDNNMMWGFVAYELGLGLALITLAHFARARSTRDSWRCAPWTIAVALTHAQAFGVLGALGMAVAGREAGWRRRPWIWLAAVAPGVLVLLPWVVDRALASGAGSSGSPDKWIDIHTWSQHFGGMFGFSTGILFGDTAHHAGKLAFASLAAAPITLGVLALRRTPVALAGWAAASALGIYLFLWPDPGGFRTEWLVMGAWMGTLVTTALGVGDRHRGAALGLLALATVLYFFFPMGLQWPLDQWYIYPRHAIVFLAIAAVVPPVILPPPIDAPPGPCWISREGLGGGRVIAILPGLAASVVLSGVAVNQFAAFAERAAPFRHVVRAVADEPRVLTLTLSDGDPDVPYHPFNQFHAYLVAQRGGYDPYLFNNPSTPFVHTKKLPHPPWNAMQRFDLKTHAPFYDYLLIQGPDVLAGQQAPEGYEIRRVTVAGRWCLYAVETATIAPKAVVAVPAQPKPGPLPSRTVPLNDPVRSLRPSEPSAEKLGTPKPSTSLTESPSAPTLHRPAFAKPRASPSEPTSASKPPSKPTAATSTTGM